MAVIFTLCLAQSTGLVRQPPQSLAEPVFEHKIGDLNQCVQSQNLNNDAVKKD
ncbi:hypothetical protein MED297_04202 [Reinekea sp. MED297]|uniref:Uncharacterized protein n=1 Tax=Reinekea blandensis MED297 TaxID=314283 RepID=A4BG45_9GAMM|nr:hypothetical protein MED297_04202 [Reinekea sp. MED297] [Reinekea blandensis MED297]